MPKRTTLRPPAVPLVDPVQFLVATRESGYRNVATALAELIDNALEAEATSIEILLEETDDESPTISVLDNGSGLSDSHLARALQFGGSHRFGSRRGIGRFGMGLPNASLSQARRVDIYSWEPGRPTRAAALDIDWVARDQHPGVSLLRRTALPARLIPYRRDFRTAVVWSRCDRLRGQRIDAIERVLASELGRIYRRPLLGGASIRINGKMIDPIDPVRVTPGPPNGRVDILPLLRIPFTQHDGRTGTIEIQFTLLPVEEWTQLSTHAKREYRITKWSGVSVLRAGREIAYGWLFMAGKRRENYDDWWRCEVSFPPSLDEAFGVSHTKQGVRPSSELLATLSPTISAQARILNREVRDRFQAMERGTYSAEVRAERRDLRLAPPRCPNPAPPVSQPGGLPPGTGKRFSLLFEKSRDRAAFRVLAKGGRLTVIVNQLHPFYTRLYSRIVAQSDRSSILAVNALILAIGRTGTVLPNTTGRLFLQHLSDYSAAFLEPR